MTVNEWATRFGAIRRAKDKTILQECERRIAAEEKAAIPGAGNPAVHRSAMGSSVDNEARRAIAKAFGRPIWPAQYED